jgi:hypothetical protein
MSNIAGKAYAMNTISPIKRGRVWINRLIFRIAGTRLFRPRLKGLLTLSLIHYARWVILTDKQFPNLGEGQPAEELHYAYEFFFSNFNGSWEQYVDSFSSAIPKGLDTLWYKNVGYPKSVPMRPFHEYNAYPLASSNDVKSAKRVRRKLLDFVEETGDSETPEQFAQRYDKLLLSLQFDLSQMGANPIVSKASAAINERQRLDAADAVQRAQSG